MSWKEIVRDGLGSISRRRFFTRRKSQERISISDPVDEISAEEESGSWAGLPPELLREVFGRLEESEITWPSRRNVVVCGSVCRSWRRICKEVVGVPEISGKITFPVSLKQPGFRNATIQCFIKRNKSSSTYQLFLGLHPDSGGKFLLAARKIRRPTHTEYFISSASSDISRNSVSYLGKLRSNFLGTKFAIYDTDPPPGLAASSSRSSRRFHSRKVSPKVPSLSFGVAHISYELNMLGSRGPRRMRCVMHSIPASVVTTAGTSTVPCAPTDEKRGAAASVRIDDSARFMESWRFAEAAAAAADKCGPLVLKNKAPRWHEQLQCWCLNFRGRVTVASVKNFQLVAANDPGGGMVEASELDKTILQFGKIGKDLFTMDYRYPLSAFQAFAICLSSFDTKLACE
ncbi:tubby-like F-box protein 10 [Wolffia australiana]